eukprot:8542822-Pyramimonas_sp.AAC.1
MACSSRWGSLRARGALLASDAACADIACNIGCAARPLEAAAAAQACSVWSNSFFLPATARNQLRGE